MAKKKQLTRSTKNRYVAGVLGGIAEYMNWDATIVRLAYVGFALFGGFFTEVGPISMLLLYVLAAVIMPYEGAKK
jgi:phage shock protein PspC (stress-responsive transcriptional regulator)